MAEIKTISVTYNRKFNLGDYNSAHIGISIWAELDDDDDPAVIRADLFEKAKAEVRVQALPVLANQKAEVERAFLGLPEEVQNEIMDNANRRGENTDGD